ncbi:MAG: MFS transporter [Desulfobacterales bacterium]|nr:MFS transporter [Desulfobacterales bacterium]
MLKDANRILLFNALLGNFLAGIAGRIFMVSLPTIAEALRTDIAGISWALLSYQIVSIGLVLIFGRLGDIYGREKIYGTGYIILTTAAFFCGLSQNIYQLVAFRIMQGAGSAMVQSSSRAIASDALPENQLGKAQGLMTSAFHTGFFLGPTIGGLIIEYTHWRGVFFFLVPIGIAGAFLTFKNMKKAEKGKSQTKAVDYLGGALIVLVVTTLTFLLDRRTNQALGAGSQYVLGFLFLSSLAGFIIREKNVINPIVELSLFKIKLFTLSSISLLILSVSHGMTGFLIPFYLQDILHISPSFMGLLFMSAPIFTISLSPLSGYLTDRTGSRLPATLGVVGTIFSIMVGMLLRPDSYWMMPALMLALGGVGSGFFNSANHAAMIGSVPKEYKGFANGALQLMFNMGHLFGISLGSFLMSLAFQFQAGNRAASGITTQDPLAFVAALNSTYTAAIFIAGIALVSTVLRGPKKT